MYLLIEAMTVEQDSHPEIVAVAERVSFKNVLKQKPVRTMVLVATFLLACAIGIVCYILLSRSESAVSKVESTLTPSTSPTFVSDDILSVAAAVSGWEVFSDTDSPQFRAVSWLSTFDEVDHEDYGGSFLQRYVLVSFFYSTNGEEWLDQGEWLNPRLHEVSHYCTLDIFFMIVNLTALTVVCME
jgi:hypothetical protein